MQNNIKIKKSTYDWILGILSILCLAVATVFIMALWNNVPAQVPKHYNAAGEIDAISDKGSIIFLLVLAWILYFFMLIVEQFPQFWNTGVTVTEYNREKVYHILKNMLVTFRFLCAADFAYISIMVAMCKILPALFTLFTLVSVFGTIAWFCFRLFRVR